MLLSESLSDVCLGGGTTAHRVDVELDGPGSFRKVAGVVGDIVNVFEDHVFVGLTESLGSGLVDGLCVWGVGSEA